MCIHMCMGTKTISIMNDAYNILKSRKHEHESFSDVIRKITRNKRDIMEFAGAWKNISEEDAEKMKRNISLLRKISTTELMKNLKGR